MFKRSKVGGIPRRGNILGKGMEGGKHGRIFREGDLIFCKMHREGELRENQTTNDMGLGSPVGNSSKHLLNIYYVRGMLKTHYIYCLL